MRPGYDENPLNPVPPVVWMLALPIILSEAAFGLAQAGFIGGGRYAGGVLRQLRREGSASAAGRHEPSAATEDRDAGDYPNPDVPRG